jgi:hypothetical protein
VNAEHPVSPLIVRWRSAVLNSTLPATAKLCLLVLADFADADGSNCYPSIEMVAAKASINEKTARFNLAAAAQAGWIERTSKGTKQGWKRFEYAPRFPEGADTTPARQAEGQGVTPARPREGADTTPGPNGERSGHGAQNVRALRPKGAGVTPDDLAITKTNTKNKQKRTRKRDEQTFRQWLESLRDDEMAIPPEDPVFEFADQAGIPNEFLHLAWRWFCQRYRDDPKTYRDWRAVFRRAVYEDWHRCWRHDAASGQLVLTNVGLQLQRQLEAQERDAA